MEYIETSQSLGAKGLTWLMNTLRLKDWYFYGHSDNEARFFQDTLCKQQKGGKVPTLRGVTLTALDVDDLPLYRIEPQGAAPERAFFYIHGGDFAFPPMAMHFQAAADIARKACAAAYLVRYPLIPDNSSQAIIPHVIKAYNAARADFPGTMAAVMGDSAGGALTLNLASLLERAVLPEQFIAISPVADLRISNPAIAPIAKTDPLLQVRGARLCAKKYYAGNDAINPLFMSFDNLKSGGARLSIFIGGNDILYPDVSLLHERILNEGIEHDYYFYEKMFHCWPLLGIPEGAAARAQIAEALTRCGA